MKNWIKKMQFTIVAKTILLVIGIFSLFMIPMIVEIGNEGDIEGAIIIAVLMICIIAFIFFATLGINTFKANKLIKAQEALGIDFEYEPLEEEVLGTCGFSGDWFLYHKNEALAFHRSYIDRVEEGTVKNGKYYTTGIHLYAVDGKKYNLVIKKTYIDEVVLRLNAWSGGRPTYMFSEGEVTSNELQLERQIEGAEKKVDWKSIRNVVLGVGAAAFVSFFMLAINTFDEVNRTEEVIDILNDVSNYYEIEEYTQYLSVVELDDVWVELYVDGLDEENEYFMEFQNISGYFIDATLVLENEDGDEIDSFELSMVRPFGSVLGTISLDEFPSNYRLEDVTYFEYDYNRLDFDVDFVDDYNEDYAWTNVLIDGSNYSIENVEESLKRLYGECVISDLDENLVYVYNSFTADTYEYNGIEYYDPTTADFMAYILLEDKVIELYSIVDDGSVELIKTMNMS